MRKRETAIARCVPNRSVWDQWLIKVWIQGTYRIQAKEKLRKYLHPVMFSKLEKRIDGVESYRTPRD